ncbi:TadE/TadG family type IV pilus assembly protein [Variovorax sp. PAMC 28711]|uniref:TadE/TadG family type IV pilus assembly protein n=1 Tax=Variovorax sp. PAMC 28711 TaxID=1795631 RepID=UPI00078DE2D5|nr:TadE family protein [Variovorax sp. PAMC 28711]AMM24611.1 hypothetical protein AX767_09805 [Variovorax sp. PAMC 28711]
MSHRSTFGARIRRSPPARAMRGATLVEMAITMVIFLMVIFAIAEMALMYKAKAVVDMAALAAARAGAVDNARSGLTSQMRLAGKSALAPLYMKRAAGRGELAGAIVRANVDVSGMFIDVLNPSPASFADHGVTANGRRFIPNDNLMYRSTQVKGGSRQNIQDANLLKIRLTYCYKPVMPLNEEFLSLVLAWFNLGDVCRAQGRVPIRSEAVVRMQSEAVG